MSDSPSTTGKHLRRSASLDTALYLMFATVPAILFALLWSYMGSWYHDRVISQEYTRVGEIVKRYAGRVEYAIDSELGMAKSDALGDLSAEDWQVTWVEQPRVSPGRRHLVVTIRVARPYGSGYEIVRHISVDTIMRSAGIAYTDPDLEFSLVDSTGYWIYGLDLSDMEPATAVVRLPGSFWRLAAVPTNGWEGTTSHEQWLFRGTLAAFFLSMLAVIHVALRRHRLLRRDAESGEAALRLSEASFRKLFDAVPDPLLVVSPAGEIVAGNGQARALFGLSFLPMTLGAVLRESGLHDSLVHECLMTPGPDVCLVVMPRSEEEGGPVYLEATTTAIRGGDDPERLLIVLHDVTESTKGALALRQSESRYRDLVDSSPEGIMLLDVDGRLVKANRRVAAMAGYADPDAMQRAVHRLVDLVDVKQRSSVMESLLMSLKGEPVRLLRLDFNQRSGDRVPVEASIAPIYNARGAAGYVVALADITRRERLQRRNRAYRHKLALLARSLGALIDLPEEPTSMQVIAQAFLELSDAKAVYLDTYDSDKRLLTPRAFAGDRSVDRVACAHLKRSLLGVGHPMDEPWHQRLLTRGIQDLPKLGGIALERLEEKEEDRILREMRVGAVWGVALSRLGSSVGAAVLAMEDDRHVAFPAIVEAYAHAVTDLIHRRQASRALLESEERYRGLMTNLGDAVIVVNDAMQIVSYRDTSEGSLGLLPSEAVGASYETAFQQLVAQGLAPSLLQGIMNHLTRVSRPGAFTWEGADGARRHLQPAVFGFRYRGTPHAALLMRDVTERELMIEKLRESERLQDLGRFASGAAHDLRHIVAVLKAEIPMIGEAIQEDPLEAQRMLTRLDHAVLLGENFCTTLVDYGRSLEPVVAPLHINLELAEQQDLMAGLLGSDITLTLDLTPELILALADSGLYERVWLNLLVNARDAMPKGGTIRLATGLVQVDAQESERLAVAPGPYAVLSVSDSGPGMTPDQAKRIFEPFYTTKRTSLAAGLGLEVVHRVMAAHHGAVKVTSALGRGTTFELYFPAVSMDEIADSEEIPIADDGRPQGDG